MRKLLVLLLAVFVATTVSCNLFAQSNNASIGGVVQDTTKALIPGVAITLTNTQTGVVDTRLTNESGSYQFPSVPPGTYKISAELSGFKKIEQPGVLATTAAQMQVNLTLQVGTGNTTVNVKEDSTNKVTQTNSSVGTTLTDEAVHNLPLVGSNVLDLLTVLPGYRENAFGPAFDTVGGLGLDTVNATINGLSTNSARDAAGGSFGGGRQMFTTTNVNPDLVGEIKLILAPVDAELGRGNAQVQIQTRSGTNKYTGGFVWNVQNSGMNANTWLNNHTATLLNGVVQRNNTIPDWTNNNQFTVNYSGPIIKNKTFFLFLYDKQFNASRTIVNNTVYTDTARNGIWRYWTGFNPQNAAFATPAAAQAAATASYISVDSTGKPLAPAVNPDLTPYTGKLVCFSVFGNVKMDGTPFTAADCTGGTAAFNSAAGTTPNGAWDQFRPNADQTGYIAKVLKMMPHPNNFTVLNSGDGLNTAVNRYLRGRKSGTGVGVTGAAYNVNSQPNRSQYNAKIDHNINKSNRISFQWTYQKDDSSANVAAWQTGLNGLIRRRPQVFTLNGTSTLSANLVNESRFGLNYSSEWQSPAWVNQNDSGVRAAALDLITYGGTNATNGKKYPIILNPGTNVNGYMTVAAGSFFEVGNTTPLWDYADTVRWTYGKHSFSFGGEYRRPMTTGFNSSAYATAAVGNAVSTTASLLSANATNFQADLPQFLQTSRTNSVTLLQTLAGSLGSASTPLWIDGYSDVSKGTWKDVTTEKDVIPTGDPTYGHQARTQITNEWSFFAKDDFKVMKRLTLNLGLRYDFNGSPYLRGGLTNTFVGDGLGLLGAGRPSGSLTTTDQMLSQWMRPGNLYLTGYGSNSTNSTTFLPLSCQVGVVQAAGLPASTCDPALQSTIQFVGPGTPNPGKTLVPQHGKITPAVGFAWQLPWFGEGKTSVRGGFQRTYGGAGSNFSGGLLSGPGGDATTPALDTTSAAIQAIVNPTAPGTARSLNLSDLATLVPTTPTRSPGTKLSNTGRSVSIGYAMYAPDYVLPYTDNWTLSVTRNFSRTITMDVRYVNTIGKKQAGAAGSLSSAGSVDLNVINVYNNPELFSALQVTRAGGNDPLFDQMLMGLNLNPGLTAFGPVGGVTAGILQRGSAAVRRAYAANLANGNFLAVMNSLIAAVPTGLQALPANPLKAGTNMIDPVTGFALVTSQRTLRNGCDRIANGLTTGFVDPVSGNTITPRCFSENYLTQNPQLGLNSIFGNGAELATNWGKSNYQSFQAQFTVRPIQGVSVSSTFSLTKNMGLPGSGYINPLNRQLDYGLTTNSGGPEFRSNGTFELPLGPNKLIFGNSSGWFARAIEKWQTSFIYVLPQGSIRDVGTTTSTNYGTVTRADVVGPWDNPKGIVNWTPQTGNSGTYWTGYISYADPQCSSALVGGIDANGTNLQSASNCTLRGLGKIVAAGTPGAFVNAAGQTVLPLLQNPTPGTQGNIGKFTLHTISRWRLDGNASKRFRITESKSLQIRIDTTNILNHPTPADPTLTMTDTFGQMTSKSGNRTFQAQARFSF